MTAGIRLDSRHSYYHFGLRMLESTIGNAPRDNRTERVAYSSITYDFDTLYGSPSYGERQLSYKFDFLCRNRIRAEHLLLRILQWARFTGRKNLYDSTLPDYHFSVRAPTVAWREKQCGVYLVTMTFMADPVILPNRARQAYTADTCRFPDIDGDGSASSLDAATILAAASAIGSGQDPGLTDEQLALCDADMDGEITSMDAALVMQFSAACGAGKYSDSPAGWASYLNDYFHLKGGVI